MTEGTKVVEPNSGTVIDTHEVDYGGGDLRKKQRMLITGTTPNTDAVVMATAPAGTEEGLVVRQAGLAHIQLFDENGTEYTSSNRLPVNVGDLTVQQLNVTFPPSVVSTNNSTDTPLAANGVFTGAWEDISKYSAISAIAYTDQPSAANGALVQFSSDGSTVVRTIAATIPAMTGLTFMFGPEAKYFRIIYTNGATAQTVFHAQVVLHYQTPSPPQLPLGATTSDLSLAESVQSHLKARQANGVYIPVRADSTGRLEVVQELPVVLDSTTLARLAPGSGPDPNNLTQTPLAANATFTGTWTDARDLANLYCFYEADVAPAANGVYIEWSDDGVTANGTQLTVLAQPVQGFYLGLVSAQMMSASGRYYRLHYTNGASAQGFFYATIRKGLHPNTGSILSLQDTVSALSSALLTRAVQAGSSPDGTFKNQVLGGIDPSQSPQLQTPAVLLAANATFTAPWASVEGFTDIAALVRSDVAGTVYFDYSMDGITQDRTFAYPIAAGTNADWVSAAPRGKYFRFRYVNGPTIQTVFKAQIEYATAQFGYQFGQLATSPSDQTIVATTKAVITGRRPDGTYVNSPETGVSASNNTATPLAANATWVGAWEICDQYSDVSVNVRSDVGGTVIFDFSQDATAVDRSTSFLYANAPVGSTFAVPVQARYVRVSYTNAGVIQTLFRLQTRLLEEGLDGATMPVVEAITDQTMAQIERAVLNAKGSDGMYRNVPSSLTGGLRTDPEALNLITIGRYIIGTTVSQIATSGFANRKTISIKSDPNNTGTIYVGLTNAVTTASGYFLAAGDSLELDIGTGQNFYAIASAAAQNLATIEVGAA